MSGIYPVVSTRVSDQLLQKRILSQFDDDKLALTHIQDQVSTGYRLTTPSDDAPAAMRALTLQRILEQKAQSKTNLQTTQSYVSASDSALSTVADQLISIRGQAISMVSTITSDSQRRSVAVAVQQAIRQLTDVANQQFRGRYLFSGSSTVTRPFEVSGDYLAYLGNDSDISSYADTDLLVKSNISGKEVFGTYSAGVEGSVDMNAVLTPSTRISDLNGGDGVRLGSIRISDGTHESTVDLSGAATVEDVVRLIESDPPSGRQLTVRLSGSSLIVDLDDAGGGNLTIHDVGNGTTAYELGIRESNGTGVSPLVGRDLNPKLNLTTRISDVLGTHAWATLESNGANNDIAIEAKQKGTAYNDYHFQYVDDSLLQARSGITAGNEFVRFSATASPATAALTFSGTNNNLTLTSTTSGTDLNNVQIDVVSAGPIGNAANVSYDPINKKLTIGIDTANRTQVQTIVNAINAEGTFTASYDASDIADGGYVGTTTIQTSDIGNVSGNTGNSGGAANTYFIHVENGTSTAEQVQAALEASTEFSNLFTSSVEGKDTTSATFAGSGGIDIDASTATSYGSGSEIDLSSGIRLVNGGHTYDISFGDAETVEDILNTLNGANANIIAEINETGTGINVRSRLSGADFQIGENGGTTAEALGIRSFTRDTTLSSLNHEQGVTLTTSGPDFTITRKDGTQLPITITNAKTIGDVIDAINNNPSNLNPANRVVARLARVGNGIELDDANTAAAGTLSITDGTTQAAVALGLIPSGATSTTAQAATRASAAIQLDPPSDANTALQITAAQVGEAYDGVTIEYRNTLAGNVATATYDSVEKHLVIDIDSSATTANTVMAAINLEGTFTANLDLSSDPTNTGNGVIGQTGTLATTSGGTDESIVGRDVNPLEVKGMFNSLLRLYSALNEGNLGEIQRNLGSLDQDFERLNFARADLGHRGKALDTLGVRLDAENVELKSSLSNEIDTDVVAAISELQARQANMEATLRLVGRMLSVNLLQFL